MTIAQELQTSNKAYEHETGDEYLKFSFDYDIGGSNYFTGDNIRRGYYLTVNPVKRVDHGGYFMEETAAFSGGRFFLNNKALARKSKKAEAEARSVLTEEYIDKIRVMLGRESKLND